MFRHMQTLMSVLLNWMSVIATPPASTHWALTSVNATKDLNVAPQDLNA